MCPADTALIYRLGKIKESFPAFEAQHFKIYLPSYWKSFFSVLTSYSAFQSVSPWPPGAQRPPYSHQGLNAVDEIWCLSSSLQKPSHWNPAMQKQVGQGRVSPGCSTQHSPAPFLCAMVPPQSPHRVENVDWCQKIFWRRGFSFQGQEGKMET